MSGPAEIHALIERLCGVPDAAAVRAVEVSNAQIAALAWVRKSTGSYPLEVSARLQQAADELCRPGDDRDPREVLVQAAAAAVRGLEHGAMRAVRSSTIWPWPPVSTALAPDMSSSRPGAVTAAACAPCAGRE